MVPVVQPGAVVGGEDEQGILFQVVPAQGFHDLSDGPVHFHHYISEETGFALPLELVRDIERDVNHAVWNIDKKGLFLVLLDEGNRPLRILRGQLLLVLARDFGLTTSFPVDKGKVRPALDPFLHREMEDARVVWPHVVGVGQAEVIVEPVLHGKKLLEVPQVPFSVAGGCVSLLLADLGDRDLLRVNADCGLGTEGTQDAHSRIVAAREQPCPRGRAHGLRHIGSR